MSKYSVKAVTKNGYVVEDNTTNERGFVRRETWNEKPAYYAVLPGFGDFSFALELPFETSKEIKTVVIDFDSI